MADEQTLGIQVQADVESAISDLQNLLNTITDFPDTENTEVDVNTNASEVASDLDNVSTNADDASKSIDSIDGTSLDEAAGAAEALVQT